MKTFRFFIDAKYSNWERSAYDIEADTYEEAEEKAKEIFNDPSLDVEPTWVDDLDTIEFLDIESNHGSPTQELLYRDENYEIKTIKTNLDEQIGS